MQNSVHAIGWFSVQLNYPLIFLSLAGILIIWQSMLQNVNFKVFIKVAVRSSKMLSKFTSMSAKANFWTMVIETKVEWTCGESNI